jgi:nucleotide-binding universal stress UspA family protein
MYRKILIANDGSPGAFAALKAALDIAAQSQAELHMVCIKEIPAFPSTMDEVVSEQDEGERRFNPIIDRSEKLAEFKGLTLQAHFLIGNPVSTIVQFLTDRDFDLLVVGFTRHSSLYQRVISTTTDRLVDRAPCAVLVVK